MRALHERRTNKKEPFSYLERYQVLCSTDVMNFDSEFWEGKRKIFNALSPNYKRFRTRGFSPSKKKAAQLLYLFYKNHSLSDGNSE